MSENMVVTASQTVAAPAEQVFEMIADPVQQVRWDGNDNLASARPGQRVHAVGEVFEVELTKGTLRPNEVVAFEEGRLIAWKPSPVDEPQPGHLWRWELEPVDESHTLVTQTYDWSGLTDEKRIPTARRTTPEKLMASIVRLKALAEQ